MTSIRWVYALLRFVGRRVTPTPKHRLILRDHRCVPQLIRTGNWIYLVVFPPPSFVTSRMIIGVMDCTKRDGEFIAHFQRKPTRLRIANVVSMG